ncbi:MAG TPA: DUF6508 domain-containing protein [Chloroflexaceae bacterium]|nr:DUF6508 domain-containing protein [Chloroflexaceae bacterium]
MPPDAPDLSLTQLDAILAFLPIFERQGYSFGEWHAPEGVFPYWDASPEASAFVATLYREQFITPFDWVSWMPEVQRYVEGWDTALATADLASLRKLMTAHMRADRFSEGTLAAQFESGHITAVLRRLKQIRDAVAARESSQEP